MRRQRRRPIQRQRQRRDPTTETKPIAETRRSKHAIASTREASAAVNRLHAQTSGRQIEPLQIEAGAEEFLAARSQESARFGEDRTRAMSRASAELPIVAKAAGVQRAVRPRPFAPVRRGHPPTKEADRSSKRQRQRPIQRQRRRPNQRQRRSHPPTRQQATERPSAASTQTHRPHKRQQP